MFAPYKDVTINLNWNTDEISTKVTTGNQGSSALVPMLSTMPSSLSTVVWAFATGECGSEVWGQYKQPETLAKVNIPKWVAAGKKYIISTGGADGVFSCGSDAGFETFVNRYMSANLLVRTQNGCERDVDLLVVSVLYMFHSFHLMVTYISLVCFVDSRVANKSGVILEAISKKPSHPSNPLHQC